MKYSMITILGPTASGKTSLAAALAARINSLGAHLSGTPAKGAEIISADSRQVYRGMDIGTGKDLADYTIHGKQIPYHLIDICEPGTNIISLNISRIFMMPIRIFRREGLFRYYVEVQDSILSRC